MVGPLKAASLHTKLKITLFSVQLQKEVETLFSVPTKYGDFDLGSVKCHNRLNLVQIRSKLKNPEGNMAEE